MSSTRKHYRLVTDIAKMIGDETYNHAPVNYGIAEKAIAIIQRRQVRPLERAIGALHQQSAHGSHCRECNRIYPCPTTSVVQEALGKEKAK